MIKERTYQFGASRLTVRFGDIVSSDAQVIVSSDDCYITMGGGVSSAILRAGGEVIALDALKKVPAGLGDIVVTTAGSLKAQYIFHAITIGTDPEGLSHKAVLERTTRRCMQLLKDLRLSSIAFPAIGAGVAGFSYEDVAVVMANIVTDEILNQETSLDATIYLFDRFGKMTEIDFIVFFEEVAKRVPSLAPHTAPDSAVAEPSKLTCLDLAAETEEEYKRRRIHNLRRLLGNLEDQRGKLEQQLIALLDMGKSGAESGVRRALKDNQELRLQYLQELREFSVQSAGENGVSRGSMPLTVFVSSTYMDLREHRAAVKNSVGRCDLFFRGMEDWGAAGVAPASLIVDQVRKADVYIGIFGVRYGSIDEATGFSMTELEFREAEASKKPMRLYLLHPDAPVTVADIESNPDSHRKLIGLKEHIMKNYTPYLFRNVDDLARQTYADLLKLKADHATPVA